MDIEENLTYPEVAIVKQNLFTSEIKDIPDTVLDTLSALPNMHQAKPGQGVAVAVGSRGIDKIDQVIFHLVKFLKKKNLNPFIVPAMGSHGGATPEGQKALLAKLGITEAALGVPIFAEMETELIGQLPNGLKIHFSRKALSADHIIAVNRVKPHTKFDAKIESGLCKIITIGLGKENGAKTFHRCAVNHTFNIIENAAKVVIEKCNIFFGMALLEDGHGNLSRIEAMEGASIIEQEKKLLQDAYLKMGRIPFNNIDVLIIDFIGKDISGIGMDSNVTGRHRDITGDFHKAPHVKRIFVRDLSPDSDGNGNGIGLADATTNRLVDHLDMKKTYINALAAISPEKAAIPIHFNTDRLAVNACLLTTGCETMENARIVRIKDTKNLGVLQVSKAFEKQVLSNPDLKLITPWTPLQFDQKGALNPLHHEYENRNPGK